MVITGDAELAGKIRILRNHGMNPSYDHRMIGINSRLDALQAAVLRIKLSRLDRWTEESERMPRGIAPCLRETGPLPRSPSPEERKGAYHIYNQFVIRAEKRDALRDIFPEGIGTEIYYPIPLHLQECYRYLGYHEGDLPESERAARETLALPIFPELTAGTAALGRQAMAEFFAAESAENAEKKIIFKRSKS